MEEEREKVEKVVRVAPFYSMLFGPKSRLGFGCFWAFKIGLDAILNSRIVVANCRVNRIDFSYLIWLLFYSLVVIII